jgi:N-acetylgalactosamine-6-sulfatase
MTPNPTRRRFLVRTLTGAGAAAVAAMGAGCGPSAARHPRRPNVLVILSDDQGYGDLGCYGGTDLDTPHVDRLAAEGVRFTNYYSAGAECTPTRTAFLTGRYFHRVGGLECAIGTDNVGRYDDAIRLAEAHDLGLPQSETTLAEMLGACGYATAVYGKWHLGYEEKFLPMHHGFDHFVGVLGGNCDYFHHAEVTGRKTLFEDDRLIERDAHMTDLITGEAVAFLRRRKAAADAGDAAPFFLYVAYTAPHSPYQGPDDRRPALLSEEEWNKGDRAGYVELVEHMDKGVGRILAALEAGGFRDDTLVIFASDNGGNRKASNAPFSGHKSSLYEGGIHVPCIARWPGRLPAGRTSDQTCITMDLTASIAAAAGVPPGRHPPLDGIDLLGRVAAGRPTVARDLFFRNRRGERTWRAVRSGDLKYLSRTDGDAVSEWLFDLAADPAEQHDLLAARPAEASRLV